MDQLRTASIISFLKQHNLQGWFSWRPEELLLQQGSVPFWGVTFLLYLADGERVLFVPELEPQDSVPSGTTIVVYPWGNPQCGDPFSVLRRDLDAELERRGISRNAIGVLRRSSRSALPGFSAEEPPLTDHVLDYLTHGMLRAQQLEDAFVKLFLYKTATEIERIRCTNQVAQKGLAAWRSALKPGVTEAEAAAAAEAAVQCQTGINGVRSARAWAAVQSGPNSAMAGRFNRSSGRKFEPGDLVLIEMGTCVNGYWTDLTRTVAIGDPPPGAAKLLNAVEAAQQAAIHAIRPNVRASELDAIARAVLSEAGFAIYFTHALGHHVGFRYHDPGFALASGNSAVLEPGMLVTIEPGAYVPSLACGARVEDDVAITDDGVLVLTNSGAM